MKKYLIVSIILIILVGVFSMDILGRSITDIQRRMVGQTNYRINVVKGIVESENINKTYNCYIAGETKVYPNIPTFSRNPRLQPGDKVTIEFINGCRETPAILAPEDIREIPDTTVIGKWIFAVFKSGADYYLNRYNYNGVLDKELGILIELTEDVVRMCIDKDQNVYILHQVDQGFPLPFLHRIYKYDKNGNHLLTKVLAENEMIAYISPDGYLYTKVRTDDFVTKRNLNDLSSAGIYTIIAGHDYRYLTFDSDGYLYTYDEDYVGGNAVLKWELGVGEIAHYTKAWATLSAWAEWAIAGDYLGSSFTDFGRLTAWIMPKNMTNDWTIWTLDGIKYPYGLASIPNYFIFLGKSATNKLIIEKYDTSRTRQWSIEIIGYILNQTSCAVAAYPF